MLVCYEKAAEKPRETFRKMGLQRTAWHAGSGLVSEIPSYTTGFVALTVLFLNQSLASVAPMFDSSRIRLLNWLGAF